MKQVLLWRYNLGKSLLLYFELISHFGASLTTELVLTSKLCTLVIKFLWFNK